MTAYTAKGTPMRVMNGRWTPASVAIMLVMMRKHGFVEKIDAMCEFDREQRVLTPGEVALLIIGATALRNRRIPLYKIGRQYESMDLRGILGRDVSVESLSDTALSRGLDTLYKADREKLFWTLAEELEKVEGLDSRVFHLDQTKIRTYVADTPECDAEAAKPMIGLDKEGRTDFFLYSLSAMTSENGNIRYFVPHDGNASDPEMDRKAIEFLIDAVDPRDCTVVTDCKGTNSALVALMDDAELGFVSKVPESYSSCLRGRMVWEASHGELRPSATRKGHAFHDIDAFVEHDEKCKNRDRKVRIVVFTSEKMRRDAEQALVRSGMKKAEKLSKKLNKAVFPTKEEAFLAIGEAQCELALEGAALDWSISSEEVMDKRTKRGRRPKDEPPTYHTEWSVDSQPIFDREMASIVAEMTAFQVLITNLPRTAEDEDPEDVREGASSEKVLRLYLDQYKQEHAFSLLKGKVGLAQVFVSKPERANAMMTVLGLAALIRNVIDGRFSRDRGIFTTSADMIDRWGLVRIRGSGGELEIDGGGDVESEMYDVFRRLDLDEGMVLDSIAAV